MKCSKCNSEIMDYETYQYVYKVSCPMCGFVMHNHTLHLAQDNGVSDDISSGSSIGWILLMVFTFALVGSFIYWSL